MTIYFLNLLMVLYLFQVNKLIFNLNVMKSRKKDDSQGKYPQMGRKIAVASSLVPDNEAGCFNYGKMLKSRKHLLCKLSMRQEMG